MKHDVVIVGAGPAGSTAAKIVAERGFKALVLEKDTLDREKPCAGGITHRVVEHFRIPEKAFVRKCTGIFLCSPKSRRLHAMNFGLSCQRHMVRSPDWERNRWNIPLEKGH